MNSLRTRLFAAFFLVILVVVVVIGLALFILLRNSSLVERPALVRLSEASRQLQRQNPLPEQSTDDELRRVVALAAETYDLRALVTDLEGQVLIDSAPDAPALTITLRNARNDPAYGLRIGQALDDERNPWLYTVRRVAPNRLFVLAAPQPRLAALRLFLDDLLTPLLQAGAIAAVVALILSSLVARWVAQPLQKMAQVAQGIARGDYAQTAPVSGPDEVRALGHSLNEMSRQVQASQQTQRDFLANVSHELKTPLTSIQGFAQAIEDGAAASPEAVKRSAEIIYQEADRMRRLVADLLELARLDAGARALNRAPLDLRLLLSSIAERFAQPAQEKGLTLKTDLPPQLPTLIGDADRLAQVITNLLDNALKHTPTGGSVTLAASAAPDAVHLHVVDTGAGIPPEDLGRIFERFYQVDKSRAHAPGGGLGLGLAITKEIVEAHRGAINVESVVGLGTRFNVRLPLSLPEDSTLIRKRK